MYPRSNGDTTVEPGLSKDHDGDAIYRSSSYSDQPKSGKCSCVLFSDDDEMDGGSQSVLEHVQTPVKVKPEVHPADAVNGNKLSSKSTTPSHVNLKLTPTGASRNGSKVRPKAGDYDAPNQQVLETAIELYHTLLLTETPFPTAQQEAEWAKGVWDMACEYHNSKASHDIALIKLVCDFSWSRECTNV